MAPSITSVQQGVIIIACVVVFGVLWRYGADFVVIVLALIGGPSVVFYRCMRTLVRGIGAFTSWACNGTARGLKYTWKRIKGTKSPEQEAHTLATIAPPSTPTIDAPARPTDEVFEQATRTEAGPSQSQSILGELQLPSVPPPPYERYPSMIQPEAVRGQSLTSVLDGNPAAGRLSKGASVR